MMTRYFALLVFALAVFGIPLHSQQQKPAIVYSTVLNGMKFEYELGRMKIENLRCVYFPDAKGSGGFAYNPVDGGKFETKITHVQTGLVFADMKWYGKKEVEPYWSFGSYDVTAESQPAVKDGWMEFKTTGDYKMEFFLDGDMIWMFPFTISKLDGNPNVDPIDKFFLEGPWDQYAELFYLGGMPVMNLKFIVWLQNKERRPRREALVQAVLTKDGALVGSSGLEAEKLILLPSWQRFEFPIAKTVRDNEGVEKRINLKAEDILKEPGNYSLVLTLNGAVYGVYSFIVKNGEIRLIQEQDPEQAKKKELIYGGDGVIWLKRGK